jgi:hypothetical protein
MSLSEEAPKGRLAGLVALRDRLAAEIDTAEQSRDVAALSRQFSDVLLQIEELSSGAVDNSKPASPLDELRRKRAERAGKTG